MPNGQVLAIAALAAMAFYGADKAVHLLKKAAHAITQPFHRAAKK